MTELQFPAGFPEVGALLRIFPNGVDYHVKNYKNFCEESHVVSRSIYIDYEGRKVCQLLMGGDLVHRLCFDETKSMWSAEFDKGYVIVNVTSVLE